MSGPLKVVLEPNPSRKGELQEHLTSKLQDWFGKADSNAHYASQAELLDGYVAEIGDVRCGLLLLKHVSPVSAEVYWLGVDPAHHRSGVGRALLEAALKGLRRGVRYLFVATLHPSVTHEPYQRTRRFYEAMDFVYVLEEHFISDPTNPIAYYLRRL
jgi:ribosomal protein S18 acetylase RimI-like enzyme